MKPLTAPQQQLLRDTLERHGLDKFERTAVDVAVDVADEPRRPLARPRSEELSAREIEVLTLMADGLENSEIGRELYLAVETIKTHVRSLLMKLPARNRTHAVAIAYRRGILEAD